MMVLETISKAVTNFEVFFPRKSSEKADNPGKQEDFFLPRRK